jgi:hypothetical protein
MLENSEGAIKNGQSRETYNIWYTRHKTKTNQKTQYVLYITLHKTTRQTKQKTQHRKLKMINNTDSTPSPPPPQKKTGGEAICVRE